MLSTLTITDEHSFTIKETTADTSEDAAADTTDATEDTASEDVEAADESDDADTAETDAAKSDSADSKAEDSSESADSEENAEDTAEETMNPRMFISTPASAASTSAGLFSSEWTTSTVSNSVSIVPEPAKHLLSCHFPFCRAPSELSGYTRGQFL